MIDKDKFYCFSCHHSVYDSHKHYFPDHQIDTVAESYYERIEQEDKAMMDCGRKETHPNFHGEIH